MQNKNEELPKSPSAPGRKRQRKAKGGSKASKRGTKGHKRKKTSKRGTRKSELRPDEILREIAGTTSQVVYQAASILEDEIAAGIVAAKQVEERLTSSVAPPSDTPNVLVQRFRKDLHEVVDILVDLIDIVADRVGMPSQPAMTMRSDTQHKSSDGRLPTLATLEPVKGGESAEVVAHLENKVDEPTAELGFVCTDLVSVSGDRIAARQVDFAPPSITIGPHDSVDFTVSVRVPRGKPPGAYSGLIRTTQTDQLQAVLVVQVD